MARFYEHYHKDNYKLYNLCDFSFPLIAPPPFLLCHFANRNNMVIIYYISFSIGVDCSVDRSGAPSPRSMLYRPPIDLSSRFS